MSEASRLSQFYTDYKLFDATLPRYIEILTAKREDFASIAILLQTLRYATIEQALREAGHVGIEIQEQAIPIEEIEGYCLDDFTTVLIAKEGPILKGGLIFGLPTIIPDEDPNCLQVDIYETFVDAGSPNSKDIIASLLDTAINIATFSGYKGMHTYVLDADDLMKEAFLACGFKQSSELYTPATIDVVLVGSEVMRWASKGESKLSLPDLKGSSAHLPSGRVITVQPPHRQFVLSLPDLIEPSFFTGDGLKDPLPNN